MEKIFLREITADTLGDILGLSVHDLQKKFVASNAVSIAQAHFADNAVFRAIYGDETPIGFVMFDDDPNEKEPHHYDLWRFMIDKNYQGRGYGWKAMDEIIRFVRKETNQREFMLSCVPGEGGPEEFYRKYGFADTGEIVEGEKVYKLVL